MAFAFTPLGMNDYRAECPTNTGGAGTTGFSNMMGMVAGYPYPPPHHHHAHPSSRGHHQQQHHLPAPHSSTITSTSNPAAISLSGSFDLSENLMVPPLAVHPGTGQQLTTVAQTHSDPLQLGSSQSPSDVALSIGAGVISSYLTDFQHSDQRDSQGQPTITKRKRAKRKKESKRKRTEPVLSREELKRRRNAGEAYVTRTGKVVEKKVYEPIECGCRLKCTEKVPHDIRKVIFEQFLGLADWYSQTQFIVSSVTVMDVKRRYTKPEKSKSVRDSKSEQSCLKRMLNAGPLYNTKEHQGQSESNVKKEASNSQDKTGDLQQENEVSVSPDSGETQEQEEASEATLEKPNSTEDALKSGGCTKNRTASRNFYLTNSKIRVCKPVFLSALGISNKRVDYALRHKAMPVTSLVTPDKRGKKKAVNKTPVEVEERVRSHIRSMPKLSFSTASILKSTALSLFARTPNDADSTAKLPKSNKHGIESTSDPSSSKSTKSGQQSSADMTITKMYSLYQERCRNDGVSPASMWIYNKVLREEAKNPPSLSKKVSLCKKCERTKAILNCGESSDRKIEMLSELFK